MHILSAQLKAEKLFVRFLSSWCVASIYAILTTAIGFDTLSFVQILSKWQFLLVMLLTFAYLTVLDIRLPNGRSDAIGLLISVFSFAALMLFRKREFYFSLVVLVVLVFVGYYLLRDDKLKLMNYHPSRRSVILGIVLAAAVYFLYVGGVTTFRYLKYSTSTYDFGIFAQMFYNMKETLLPMTTCERDGLLSHFAIHLSPIYYLLLPVYAIFPSPITLQLSQALVVVSGVVPLYLLSGHFQLGGKTRLGICVAYCLYPALMGGCFYDIHENMFLAPLLLWLMYFLEKGQTVGLYISAVLTLMVKEDAAIYVACVALFAMICQKKWRDGAILFVGAVTYFFAALGILNAMGHGAMLGRYGNFMTDPSGGMLDVVKTIFLNPAYMFTQLLTEDKFRFLLLMLLPVGALPLLNRRLSQLVLLIPFLVVNLLTNYVYQYSIYFQYIFGSSALIFYLSVRNLSEMRSGTRRYIVPFIVVASCMLSISTMSGYSDNFSYIRDHAQYRQLDAYLEMVPEEATVQASGFFVPALSQRPVIYNHESKHKTEYIVLDLRPGYERNADALIKKYEEEGYVRVAYEPNLIIILHDPHYAESASS